MDLLAKPLQPRRASICEFLAFVLGYLELLIAWWDAEDKHRRPRDHPVSLRQLYAAGVSADVLVWMLYHGHIEHLGSTPATSNGGGTAERAANSLITEASSFVLTEAGEAFADQFLADVLAPAGSKDFRRAWGLLRTGRLVPHYEREQRIFCWGQQILKHFRQPSPNQEIVLCSAEEPGWPTWFDDPLPRGRGDAKQRLHDTIKDLNRRQRPYLVHFKGDGTGTRIGWELR